LARIAVTGAAGFIGRHLCAALSAAGHEVFGFVRRIDAASSAGVPLAVLDSDPQVLASRLAGTTLLVHAAATSPASGRRVECFVQDNIQATAGLLQAAHLAAVPHVIQLSAISVYGRPSTPLVDETTPLVDPDAYGLSKRMAELLVAQAVAQGEMAGALILRLPGVVGPGMRRPWLGELARGILAGREVAVYNPDALFNNAIHIDSLCGFVIALAERPLTGMDCVNLAAGHPLPVVEVVEELRRQLSSDSPVRVLPAPTPSFVISIKRAEHLYNFNGQEMIKLLAHLSNDILRTNTQTENLMVELKTDHA
jgi:nucleoside-diphosphate-sugar epimerase